VSKTPHVKYDKPGYGAIRTASCMRSERTFWSSSPSPTESDARATGGRGHGRRGLSVRDTRCRCFSEITRPTTTSIWFAWRLANPTTLKSGFRARTGHRFAMQMIEKSAAEGPTCVIDN
jgi:hypothetical protein